MKKKNTFVAMLLVLAMVIAMVPFAASAEAMYVGGEPADDQIVHYAGREWIVMDADAAKDGSRGLVLLAKDVDETIPYNESGLGNDWDSSSAKAWCAALESEFSAAEWAALSADKAYFLSYSEVAAYYADNTLTDLKTSTGWWLRNVEEAPDVLYAPAVSDAGFLGFPHVAANYGARPALSIPSANIVMMTAVNSKPNTVATTLAPVTANESGSWELTVVDSAKFAGFTADVVISGTKASVTFSGAATGESKFVSAVLTDRLGEVLYYGHISNAASGTVEVALPEDLMGIYTLHIFNEEVNADGTDYSSAATKEALTIEDSHGTVVEWYVNVGGDITANFSIVPGAGIVGDTGATVAVTAGTMTKSVLVSELETGTTVTGGIACFKLPVDLVAPQMSDVITIQVKDSGGNGGAEQKFSIREYGEYIINSSDPAYDSAQELAKHMLNYGAKAQTYFGYNATDLANKNIGQVTVKDVPNDGLESSTTGTVENIKFYGASLVLKSKTTLRFYFILENGADITGFEFSGNVYKNGNYYCVDVTDIAPNKLNQNYTVTVNGEMTVSYNPMSYIQRQYHNTGNPGNLRDLLQAMYSYYLAAVDFAG